MKDAMRTVIVGFVAGALSVLVFHQLGFWLSSKLLGTGFTLYNMRPGRSGVAYGASPRHFSCLGCPAP
jgi:hypothetical protein